MAVAAATAVITPAAFLMAPAAYATDPAPATTETTQSTGTSDDAQNTDGSTTSSDNNDGATSSENKEGKENQDGQNTTPDENTENGQSTPSDEQKDEENKDGQTPSEGEDKPAPAPSTSTSAPAPTPSPSEPGELCEGFADNAGVHTELRGVPSKVVAGSGWKNFTFRVENKTDKVLDGVEAYVFAAAVDGKDFDDMSQFVTVQANLGDGWEDVTDEFGYFGTAETLKPGEYADAPMRLKVDAKAPAGFGVVISSGVNVTKDGVCEFGDETVYEFDILAAGTKPGKVDDATGKPGKGGNKPAPTGELSTMPVTGSLANTGSSSMLPTIGLAGGIAIVAGAGVVFALKRRNSGATA